MGFRAREALAATGTTVVSVVRETYVSLPGQVDARSGHARERGPVRATLVESSERTWPRWRSPRQRRDKQARLRPRPRPRPRPSMPELTHVANSAAITGHRWFSTIRWWRRRRRRYREWENGESDRDGGLRATTSKFPSEIRNRGK